jgi:hypothetical protein
VVVQLLVLTQPVCADEVNLPDTRREQLPEMAQQLVFVVVAVVRVQSSETMTFNRLPMTKRTTSRIASATSKPCFLVLLNRERLFSQESADLLDCMPSGIHMAEPDALPCRRW